MGTKIVQLRPRGTGSERDVANVTVCGHDAIGNGANPAKAVARRMQRRRRRRRRQRVHPLARLHLLVPTNETSNFLVGSDLSAALTIRDSLVSKNPSAAFETGGFRDIRAGQ